MTRREWLATLTGMSTQVFAGRDGRARAAAQSDLADPTSLSIAELRAALESGRLSPIETTAAYLKRIDERDGALGAYITVARDRALDETRRLLTRATTGTALPLAGVPVAHKDLLLTRGVRTTAGSRLHASLVPDSDATLVARFAASGAVMLGKTNTHELGGGVTTINPFFGTTHNPHDSTRIPGGSSGGSAAAVVDRLALVATGSDTGGSIRIPAAMCGCVGFKPTFGLMPTTGLLGACPTFDHVGWLTRSAEDATIVLDAIALREPTRTLTRSHLDIARATTARGLGGLRIGVPRRYFFDALDADVRRAVEWTLSRAREAGAIVQTVALPVDERTYASMFEPIVVREIRATLAEDWKRRPDAFSKDFAAVFEGAGPSDASIAQARAARDMFERTVSGVLSDVDVIATPTVPVVAPPITGPIDGMRILRNTWAFNAARVPAVSLPCGDGRTGLPIGLQLVGRMNSDAALLGHATLVERLATVARP